MSIDATRSTWKLQNITAIQKLLLLSLADRADEEGNCYPSLKRIQEDTQLNRKTIIENRQLLIEKGLLVYTGEFKGKKKQIPIMHLTYVNHREGIINHDEYAQYFTSTENGTGELSVKSFTSTENGTRTSTENGTLNLKEEPNNKNLIVDSKKSTRKTDYESDEKFMAFYKLYPRKEKPRDAYKAFKSIVGENKALYDEIMADLYQRITHHSKWQQKQFIEFPATYLRSDGWKSEIFNAETEEKSKKEAIKKQQEKNLAELEALSKRKSIDELQLTPKLDEISRRNGQVRTQELLKSISKNLKRPESSAED